MLELFYKGGPLMYPILLCSVMSLAIFFERAWSFFWLRRGMHPLVREVVNLVQSTKVEEALAVCRREDTPLARIFAAALPARGRSREQLKIAVEEVGARETLVLERYLGLLGTLATISPLLGLLGTVLGMIEAFTIIAAEGVGTPATLGGGISEALITTAAGLSVAIPILLVHRYLVSRAEQMVLEMEKHSLHVIDLLGA